jgi:hypothetical protein
MSALSRITWYKYRLVSMSIPELGYRLRHRIMVEIDRIFTSNRRQEIRGKMIPEFAWDFFLNERSGRFYFDWSDRDEIIEHYQQTFPSDYVNTIQSADDLLKHKFQLFSQEFTLPDKIDWHTDPLTQQKWPFKYWSDIDTRDGFSVGGVKWTWELNRHHHLVTLSKAYFLTGNEQYAAEVCAQLSGWMETNPAYMGINWSSALEQAIRLINWCWVLAFIRHSTHLTRDLFRDITISVYEQLNFIQKYRSSYSSANNHLIGEAAGLAIAGQFFSWLPKSIEFRNLGYAILENEIGTQIYPDGISKEQSIHYLTFVLDLSLLSWRLAALNQLPVPDIWFQRFRAACNFLHHIVDNKGNLPNTGDSDDAILVPLNHTEKEKDPPSFLVSAAVILKDPSLKTPTTCWDEKNQWILGRDGNKTYDSLPTNSSAPQSSLFDQGGYCVMRTPETVIVFDCGPLGYLSTAAHGHADALHLTVSRGGIPLLIDSGTYAYQEGGRWRNYFRSTVSHNTIIIDGGDQSEILGTFLWGRKANAQLLKWDTQTEYDIAVGEHDGYHGVGVMHRRSVVFLKPDWIFVSDWISGTGNHTISQPWHLPAHSEVELGQDQAVIKTQGITFSLHTEESSTRFMTVINGSKNPIQGWTSKRYGQKEPSPVINISGSLMLPQTFVTAFCLGHSAPKSEFVKRKERVKQLLSSNNLKP